MSLYVVDVEADGPIPGDYSMVKFGAVKVTEDLEDFFVTGVLEAISDKYVPEALAISGVSRQEMLKDGIYPKEIMASFEEWIRKTTVGRPIFISDNNSFDWMFICWYFHHFLGINPFGYSSRRIGDLYCGLVKDGRARWKQLRKTKHDHNPVNDAMGNAEVIVHMVKEMGLKMDLK